MTIYELLNLLEKLLETDIRDATAPHVEILRHKDDGGGPLVGHVQFNGENGCVELSP
jgi:hypothetical protein